MEIPKDNYVGILQEKCQSAHSDLPTYEDVSVGNTFEFTCNFKDITCNGTGSSKKFAKQNAARKMIEKIESQNLLPSEQNKTTKQHTDAVSKLNIYCSKQKINKALFSELPVENGLYCCQCSLDGYSANGTGNSKKEAREKAALAVVEHFKIDTFLSVNMKERGSNIRNSMQELMMFCQKKHLGSPCFEDEEIKMNNSSTFKVTCSIGDLKIESSPAASKKAAKQEAATLMLQSLKNTPQASPVGGLKTEPPALDESDASPTKRVKAE